MITKSKNFDDVMEALEELEPRARTYARQVFAALGDDVFDRVRALLRPKFWWQKPFKKSLKYGYLTDKDQDFLAVYGDKPGFVNHLDATRMLIWFGNTTNKMLASRADLFRKFNPWTVDTLPKVAADLYGARAKVRVMSPAVVTQRRRELRKQMPQIMKTLLANKVPIKKGPAKLNNRTVFDLEHALLSQEFFRGGRPVFRQVLRQINQLVARASAEVDPDMMLDPEQGTAEKDGFGEIPKLDPALLPSISEFQSKIIGKKVRE